jgi:hypothetical protein
VLVIAAGASLLRGGRYVHDEQAGATAGTTGQNEAPAVEALASGAPTSQDLRNDVADDGREPSRPPGPGSVQTSPSRTGPGA